MELSESGGSAPPLLILEIESVPKRLSCMRATCRTFGRHCIGSTQVLYVSLFTRSPHTNVFVSLHLKRLPGCGTSHVATNVAAVRLQKTEITIIFFVRSVILHSSRTKQVPVTTSLQRSFPNAGVQGCTEEHGQKQIFG